MPIRRRRSPRDPPIPSRLRGRPHIVVARGTVAGESRTICPGRKSGTTSPPHERVCSCGREKAPIGEDVTEQLDYVPGKLVVLRHVYPKYACSCCKDESVPVVVEKGFVARRV